MPPKIRAGMGDVTTEFVEVYSDADYQRATGLWSILGADGRADPARVPKASAETWRSIYRGMLRIRHLDERLTSAAQQGRIAGHVDARGQEAAVIAPVAALETTDWVVPAHREGGAALYRGMSMRSYVAHAFGNANDLSKGRQAPGHPPTPRALNVLPTLTSSSTKLPQATGLAWAAKIKQERTVVLSFLGEGATSAEDFHTGINFAAVFKVPAIFVCVNNGWSVSTPAAEQSGSETFAVKALAYGIPGIRVDGNDPLVLFAAVTEAIARARLGQGPTLIEAVTYRLGGFNAADDSSRYRNASDLAAHVSLDPLKRFSAWLESTALLDAQQQQQLSHEIETEVSEAISAQSSAPAPSLTTLIEDVYVNPPAALQEQLADLVRIRGK